MRASRGGGWGWVLSAGLVTLACGSSGLRGGPAGAASQAPGGSGGAVGVASSGADGGALEPSIAITHPSDSDLITLGTDPLKSVPIAFDVQGFSLAPPGACPAGSSRCGHVHLLVEGAACDAPGRAFNAEGGASPISAALAYCGVNTGAHAVRLELRHDDDSPVTVGGQTVAAQVTIATRTGGGDQPSIGIVDPANGGAVALGADQSVPIHFTVSNYTLSTACGSTSRCGHVQLIVDGATVPCNAGTAPYNDVGARSPLAAKLAFCAAPTGDHVIAVALYRDDGSKALDGGGNPVEASIAVTAVSR